MVDIIWGRYDKIKKKSVYKGEYFVDSLFEQFIQYGICEWVYAWFVENVSRWVDGYRITRKCDLQCQPNKSDIFLEKPNMNADIIRIWRGEVIKSNPGRINDRVYYFIHHLYSGGKRFRNRTHFGMYYRCQNHFSPKTGKCEKLSTFWFSI